ncbi:YccF domain-containing protein [Microbacterium sp.]|uniref:YccF domain-containing protein n=1 Tax=Microbacterium sp. TaxID=51671 RepID=UPI002C257ABC|nr:YccF domain-containing protein [Microbacterium sp.]HWL77667.1 YccF domain-containing protein [Microbacterium sp.]
MRTVLNVIWLVLSGFWLFLGYVAAGILLCVLIVTIPWGIASFRIAAYALWPFGRTIVEKQNSGVWAFLGNVVWVILAGWWLAVAHIVSGVLLCLTIIGIPLGIADFKMVPISIMPLGKDIVSTHRGEFDEAMAKRGA